MGLIQSPSPSPHQHASAECFHTRRFPKYGAIKSHLQEIIIQDLDKLKFIQVRGGQQEKEFDTYYTNARVLRVISLPLIIQHKPIFF